MLRTCVGAATGLLSTIIASTLAGFANAQIRTDGSFGPTHTFTGSSITIGAEFGTLKGTNLFHSFSTFNVEQNETATFTGPSSVANIIGRVTGGMASSVNGTIQSKIPKANLILVNPAGWVFGSKASLNVSGSVHISTADTVRFADGTTMPAGTPQGSSLTVAPPAAFGFLGPIAGNIRVTGDNGAAPATLGVPKNLSLVGGPVTIQNAAISSDTGRIRIISAASAGNVAIQNGGASKNARPAAFGPVTISNNANITVNDASGSGTRGGLQIKGGEVSIARGSQILVGNTADANYPTISIRGDDVSITGTKMLAAAFGPGIGGTVKVKSKGSVTLGPDDTGNTAIFAGLAPGIGAVNPPPSGNIDITGGTSVAIRPGTSLATATLSAGSPARISLQAPDITISGPNTGIASTANTNSMSNAGPISLSGNTITIANGALVAAAVLGGGNNGDITITASQLNILDGGQVNTSVIGTGMGHGGNINVLGTGPGSQVTIYRSSGSGRTGLFSETNSGSNGSGGQVFVQADRISLQGGEISSTSFGLGPAGSVAVQAHDLRIDGMGFESGVGLFSNVQPNAVEPGVETGSAGSVTVTANTVALANGAFISSGTLGNGNGGSISVTTNELSIDSHSGVLSRTGAENGAPWWTGNGGQIGIRADQISVTGAGTISTSSLDAGKGGNVVLSGRSDPLNLLVSGAGSGIQAQASSSPSNGAGSISILGRNLTFTDGGEITTEAAAGGGGQINLGAIQLIRLDNGDITTSVSGGTGNAGDITIDSRSVVLDQGRISANADAGRGGHIDITANTYIASPDSVLEASAPHGVNGIINIQAPQSNVAGTLAVLPANLLTPPALQQRGCSAAAASQGVSSFVLGSAGGLPRTGEGPQAVPYIDLPEAPAPFAMRPGNTSILSAMQDPAQACWR
jgi:filamentous hemagglutinin family protein